MHKTRKLSARPEWVVITVEPSHPLNAIVLSLPQGPPQSPLAEAACGCTWMKTWASPPKALES